MDWTQFATFLIANMGFTLMLWFWNRTEANADRRDIMQLIAAIHDEMKDFHGRLERQDAEFKAHLYHQDKK